MFCRLFKAIFVGARKPRTLGRFGRYISKKTGHAERAAADAPREECTGMSSQGHDGKECASVG